MNVNTNLQSVAAGLNTPNTILLAGGAGPHRFDTNGNAWTLSGNIVNSGSLVKIGPGVLTLLGNDSYTVDNAGDVVTENAGEGTDEVRTGLAAYVLAANVEILTATSSVNPDSRRR